MSEQSTSTGMTEPGRSRPPSARKGDGVRRWAVCVSVTGELLNDIAMIGLADGIYADDAPLLGG